MQRRSGLPDDSLWPKTRPLAILVCLFALVFLVAINLSSGASPFLRIAPVDGLALAPEPKEGQNRTKLADGEYKVYTDDNGGGIGPFVNGVYNFTESWTLWRLPDASLEVEGRRDYESPEYEHHGNPFMVRLSSDFRTINLKEFRSLRWRADSGPLSCDFLAAKLICTSNAKASANEVGMNMAMEHPYGFLWPISAFSLSNIARYALDKKGDPIIVEMVLVDEPSAENPIRTSVVVGNLQYQASEMIRVAGRRWQADRFELKVALHAPFLIWTSPSGLLLDFAEEDNNRHITERGMTIVRYQQYTDF